MEMRHRGDTAMVNLVVDKGADVDMQQGWRGLALQAAAVNGSLDVSKLLVRRGLILMGHRMKHGVCPCIGFRIKISRVFLGSCRRAEQPSTCVVLAKRKEALLQKKRERA